MTSSNINIFHATGPLWGDSTSHRWILLTKASDAELWYFLWSTPKHTVEETIEMPVIGDAIALIMTSSYWITTSEKLISCVLMTWKILGLKSRIWFGNDSHVVSYRNSRKNLLRRITWLNFPKNCNKTKLVQVLVWCHQMASPNQI